MLGGEVSLVTSPLKSTVPPPASWVGSATRSRIRRRRLPKVIVAGRHSPPKESETRAAVQYAAMELQRQATQMWSNASTFGYQWFTEDDSLPVPVLAINLADESNLACVNEELSLLRDLQNEKRSIHVSKFLLQFYRENDGTPRVMAFREVTIDGDPKLRRRCHAVSRRSRTRSCCARVS
jgi:hypothetical protein